MNKAEFTGAIAEASGLTKADAERAVEAMFEQLAYEVAPHGIEVVIIEPGGFQSLFRHPEDMLATGHRSQVVAFVLLDGLGQPIVEILLPVVE